MRICRGFTLLEVLVAASLLAVVVTAAIVIWLQFAAHGKKGYASIHAMRDLNLVFVRLRDDLASIIIDRKVEAANGLAIDVCLSRTTVAGVTREVKFFKVYDSMPRTLQPVAGQISYSLLGEKPPYTLRRGIYQVTSGGISPTPVEHRDYCWQAVDSFRVAWFRRDVATGDLREFSDDKLTFDSPALPDCLYMEMVHKDASRIRGYVTIASRYIRAADRSKDLYFVDDWLIASQAISPGSPTQPVVYDSGNSLNIGGTGVILSSSDLH